jgi:hypothetical protein
MRPRRTAAFDTIQGAPDPIDKNLDAEVIVLEDNAAKLDKTAASDGTQRLLERERLAKLKDRKKLADDLETVRCLRSNRKTTIINSVP